MEKSNEKTVFHGSDLELIEKKYNISKEDITNFSANVNPLGISSYVKEMLKENIDIISTYPDRKYTELRDTLSAYCSVCADFIAVGNGSTELISLLIEQRHTRHALVIGPTYSEYERELSLCGGNITMYQLDESCDFSFDPETFFMTLNKASNIDLVILCNPNNPTSSALNIDELEQLISYCRNKDIFVMIDETYIEFVPDIGVITAMPLIETYDNFMIIRGVSKFFASPGLRLGYGITSNQSFLERLKVHQNPWTLNSIAAYAGTLLFKDKTYINKTRSLISQERNRLFLELTACSHLKLYQPYANFMLVRLQKGITSKKIFESLLYKGILTRDCSSFEGLQGEYIRFCIQIPEENDRLLKYLKLGTEVF